MMWAVAVAHADEREDDIFGGGSTTVPDVEARLAEEEDKLAIGGRLYLRMNAFVPVDAEPEDVRLTSPNLLDLFVDARPNDRLRGFAQARLSHDWTVQEGDTDALGQPTPADLVTLDQVWIKGDVAHKLFVTAGQQRIKWGAGRFWNPTDFLNQQALDPLAVFDERTGVALLKLHVPLEKAGTNLYGLVNLDGAAALAEPGGAVRAEVAAGPGEITVSTAARKDQPLRLGGDLSFGLSVFDLHVEGAVQHGEGLSHWEGSYDAASFAFPDEIDTSEEWIPQVVAGVEVSAKYNDEDVLIVGVEYFYNGAGYDDAVLYPWLFVSGDYTPFYLGRHYGAAYVFVPGPGRLDDTSLNASVLGNLSDQSYAARLQLSQVVLTQLTLTAYGTYHFGEVGEFNYSLDVPAIPGILPDGLHIARPLVDVGIGASLEF